MRYRKSSGMMAYAGETKRRKTLCGEIFHIEFLLWQYENVILRFDAARLSLGRIWKASRLWATY